MAERMIIKYSQPDVHKPTPWPIGLVKRQVEQADTTHWIVTSGLGPDDRAVLVGFGPAGEYRVTVYPEAAATDPGSVVGLVATFSKDGGFFEWKIPIAELQVSA